VNYVEIALILVVAWSLILSIDFISVERHRAAWFSEISRESILFLLA